MTQQTLCRCMVCGLAARHVRRIDRAAASINVNRVDVIRAIVRQAIDAGPAEIVTGWGRSERV